MRFVSLVCFASVRSQFNSVYDDTDHYPKNSVPNTNILEKTDSTSENTPENTPENTLENTPENKINPALLQKRQGKKTIQINESSRQPQQFRLRFPHTTVRRPLFTTTRPKNKIRWCQRPNFPNGGETSRKTGTNRRRFLQKFWIPATRFKFMRNGWMQRSYHATTDLGLRLLVQFW